VSRLERIGSLDQIDIPILIGARKIHGRCRDEKRHFGELPRAQEVAFPGKDVDRETSLLDRDIGGKAEDENAFRRDADCIHIVLRRGDLFTELAANALGPVLGLDEIPESSFEEISFFGADLLGFLVPPDGLHGLTLFVEKRDLITVADPNGGKASAVSVEKLRNISFVAVIEHHGPVRLVGQERREPLSGDGVKGPEDGVLGIDQKLLPVLGPPMPGVVTVGPDESEPETPIEVQPPNERAVRPVKRDVIEVLEDGQLPLGSENDLAWGLKIAGPLTFLAEPFQQPAVRRELENRLLSLVEHVKISGIVFADRGDGTEQELFPADLERRSQFDRDWRLRDGRQGCRDDAQQGQADREALDHRLIIPETGLLGDGRGSR